MKTAAGCNASSAVGRWCAATLLAWGAWTGVAAAAEGDAEWIWSPSQPRNAIPEGECFFRKTFQVTAVEEAQIQITADNRFELTLNGQPVGQGADWRQVQVFDVTELLRAGRNVVAVRVTNTDRGAAGLVARVLLKERSGTYESHSTDATWKTSTRHTAGWTLPQFADRDWINAASFGTLGDALPWGNELVLAGQGARFVVPEEFTVERLMRDSEVGSLIAMTFDARGDLYLSQEGGGIALATDSDGNGTLDSATSFCTEVQNAQGLLALGSRLFAVGDGPDGSGLYRIRDVDRDQRADDVVKIVGFRGSRGEHGPHAIRLGPDGLLYVVIGNHARVDASPVARSAYRGWYEGDLATPRYEDPQGHAVGIPAPGGTIIRTDADGKAVELVAGGFRNAYDFAFDADGELFAYDADMEWDRGAPWYRPTRITHVPAGAEFGWRSGWAKWPDYYFDSLPAALDMGQGSPTGMEFYHHTAYPEKYHGALFACDWATGRIHAVRFTRNGATYRGVSEIFVEGRPLNATDVVVGPDGAIYFCTGGRGTDGGVYRVRYVGAERRSDPARSPLDRALTQPQPGADWARGQIALVRRELGEAWGPELATAAADAQRPVAQRLQAVDLLVYFGPRPDGSLLLTLAEDAEPRIRAKAARLMFAMDDDDVRARLQAMLRDDDALVRRVACESLARRGPLPAAVDVWPLLLDDDRATAFAARRLLEQIPVDQWNRTALEEQRPAAFALAGAALANVRREASTSRALLERLSARWQAADADQRLNLLRLAQLALIHGQLTSDQTSELGGWLLTQYPTEDLRANRELVRLLAHLQVAGAAAKFAAQVASDIPWEDKLHVAAYAARLEAGWTPAAKLEFVQFLEEARGQDGGYSVSAYVEQFARDYLAKLNPTEKQGLLAAGEKWPATSLSILATLPAEPGPQMLTTIQSLDARIAPLLGSDDAYRRLRVGGAAVLGRTSDPGAHEYLRHVYRSDPEFRLPAAMSLTQHPTDENWAYLVDSLKTAEGVAAREILVALRQVPMRPRDADPYRQAILTGLRLRQQGGTDAAALLAHWSQESAPVMADAAWQDQLAAWQRWYEERFPDALPARLPLEHEASKWSYDELRTFVESEAGRQGDPEQGRTVFAKAQCAKCHRMGEEGETMGPDLTTVAARFQRKEVLESIVFPSHIISDQYASRVVMANGKTYAGLVAPRGADGLVILLDDGRKVELSQDEIDDVQPSQLSAMPTGLLDDCSLEEVAHLFAYLYGAPRPVVAARESLPQSR